MSANTIQSSSSDIYSSSLNGLFSPSKASQISGASGASEEAAEAQPASQPKQTMSANLPTQGTKIDVVA